MEDQLTAIQNSLYSMLTRHEGALIVSGDAQSASEAKGTKEVMQGKKKVDGHYFASIVPKPKDVRFYYFPIYTHPDEFALSDELKKCLKGKSCFHFKKMSSELEREISAMVDKGVELYKKDGII